MIGPYRLKRKTGTEIQSTEQEIFVSDLPTKETNLDDRDAFRWQYKRPGERKERYVWVLRYELYVHERHLFVPLKKDYAG